MTMSKVFLGLLMLLIIAGCGGSTKPTVEPSPEKTPWLFPEPQIELLKSDDYRVRGLAAKNLGGMGAKAEIAIPALEKLLENKNEKPKVLAVIEEALKQIRGEQGEEN